MQAAGIQKGSAKSGSEIVGTISVKHLFAIAETKQGDPGFTGASLESITKMILGTAKNMGIKVEY